MKKIAIIPARKGSKRIPNKNTKLFLGKPIIEYAIDNAIQSNLFNEVMVSTDDEDIAKFAMKKGAKVPFMRSEENSDDFATTVDVLIEGDARTVTFQFYFVDPNGSTKITSGDAAGDLTVIID